MSEMEKNTNIEEVKAEKVAKPAEKKPNFLVRTVKRIGRWFVEMKSELKKVVWPTRKQLINNFLVVFAVVIIIGVIIGLYDWGLSSGINALIDFVQGDM